MEAILDVDGIAYCSLEIEGSDVPPTMNFIDTIYIQDGFSLSVPVLQLILNDSKGTLSAEMNLQDGTLITIKVGKDRSDVKTRKFRVFSFKKETTAAGPHLVVNAIYDCPKWIAGVFTESFQGTSSSVMGQIVSRAGLKYSGPDNTDDKMTWLNVNKTRAAFSEDVAIRGYGSKQTCMYRLLTMDGEVRYKDLFAILKESPKFSLLQNVPTDAAEGTPIIVRETQDASVSGFPTHFMNYGKKQYEHSLNVEGQQSTEELSAPVLGAGLPINDDVKGQVSQRGARVTYTGWDTGTEPKPASNLHEYYEESFYQNIRYYGLFSERLVLLSDMYTDATTFDCVEYKHADQEGQEFNYSKTLAGKWLLGGKTLWIKAGHKYSEAYYLYRANIMESGRGSPTGSSQSNAGQANAKANQGTFNLASDFSSTPNAGGGTGANAAQPESTSRTPQEAQPSTPAKPGAVAAKDTLNSMVYFHNQNPSIPTQPSGNTVAPQTLVAQQQVRESVTALNSSAPPMNTMVHSPQVGDINDYKVVKRYEPSAVEFLANNQTSSSPVVIRSTGMQRVSSNGNEINQPIRNVVASPLSGIVGDVARGGVWTDNLVENNISPSSIVTDLPAVSNYSPSATFVQEVSSMGYTRNSTITSPKVTATNLKEWATTTTPERLLTDSGARTYIDTFGYISPDEAKKLLGEIEELAEKVEELYADSEVLIDSGDDIIESTLDFGDSSTAPIIDVVKDVTSIGEATEIVTTKQVITWAQYFNLGFDGTKWVFPFQFPNEVIAITDDTNGNVTIVSNSLERWMS